MMQAACQIVLLTIVSSSWTAAEDLDATSLYGRDLEGKLTAVSAVKGKSAQLPCDVTAPVTGDRLRLVLWYYGTGGKPFYTYDARGKGSVRGSHWVGKNVDKKRVRFQADIRPATLRIKDLRESDQKLYRCRVDFLHSPTRNSRVNLTVIVPPDNPTVFDSDGRIVEGRTEPLREGQTTDFECITKGGWPPANVTWWRENALLDKSWRRDRTGEVTNRLTVGPLTRHDLGTEYICWATNHVLSTPKSTSIALDMILRPLSVGFMDPPDILSAGVSYQLTCQSIGSRPAAVITWWMGSKQLANDREEITEGGNRTVSTLTLVPEYENVGQTVRCRAENPRLRLKFLEDKHALVIHYRPMVTLSSWSAARKEGIMEGDDVHMKCMVQADPSPTSIKWMRAGRPMSQHRSLKYDISGDEMILRHVTKEASGLYSCRVENSEGATESNQVSIEVQILPECNLRSSTTHAARGEPINVTCDVSSVPTPTRFIWALNNSVGLSPVPNGTVRDAGMKSHLTYTPSSIIDYGMLMCWAENVVGKQLQPCVFSVIMTERPGPPSECRMVNRSTSAIELLCQPGPDGGLQQTFMAEAELVGQSTAAAKQVSSSPRLLLEGLQADSNYTLRIYAFNTKGKSDTVVLQATTLQEDTVEPLRFLASVFQITPVLGVLIGVLGTCVVLALAVFITLRMRVKRSDKSGRVPATFSHITIEERKPANTPNGDIDCKYELMAEYQPPDSSALFSIAADKCQGGHYVMADTDRSTPFPCTHANRPPTGADAFPGQNSTQGRWGNSKESLSDPVERDMAERLGRGNDLVNNSGSGVFAPNNILNHYPPESAYGDRNSYFLAPQAVDMGRLSGSSDASECPGCDATFSETTSTVGELAPLMSAANRRESSV